MVLSPHLDDAVLSASAAVASEPDAAVVTCFAGVPPPGTPPSMWDVRTGIADPHTHLLRRRQEDLDALLALGAGRAVHLDLLDAPYRSCDDEATFDLLLNVLRLIVPDEGRLLGPLGIGGHPDHVLTRRAALALSAERPALTLSLYADQPYALEHGWPTQVLPRSRQMVRWLVDGLRTAPDRNSNWRPALVAAGVTGPGRTTVLRGRRLARKRAAVSAHVSQLGGLGGAKHAAGRYEVAYEIAHGRFPDRDGGAS